MSVWTLLLEHQEPVLAGDATPFKAHALLATDSTGRTRRGYPLRKTITNPCIGRPAR